MNPFLIFFLLLASSIQHAHATQFQGVVLTKGTKVPVTQANLILLPYKIRIVTDQDGKFKTESIPPGKFQWIIQQPGFERLEVKDESTTSNETEIKKFYLDSVGSSLFETVVVSKEQKDTVQKTMSRKEAESLPGAGADPLRAIQNMPGVNKSAGFSSQVIIQGSAPQDTHYSIDGHEIPLVFHFGGLSSVFSPELTESFDFLSAGYQVPNGRAMGGIININTRDLDAKQTRGMAFVDIFNTGAAIETNIGKESHLAIGARASYIGQVLKAAFKNNDNFNLTVAPSYDDFSLIYDTRLSSQLKFKLVGIASKDTLEFVLNNPVNDDPKLRGNFSSKTGFFRLIPEFIWTHSPLSETRFSLGLGRDFVNFYIGDQYFNLKTIAVTTRVENKTKVSATWTRTFGIDNNFSWADVSFQIPQFIAQGGIMNPASSSTTRTANLTAVPTLLVGVYWNNVLKTSPDSLWTFYPGVRIDYFDPTKEVLPSPRMALRYALTPSLDLITAGGLYFQPPLQQQVSPSYGNPAIKSPYAWHVKVGAEKNLSQELSQGSEVTTGVFWRSFQNLIIPSTSTVYSNLGTGKAYGWENSFKYYRDIWNFWATYTLSRSTRADPSHAEYLYQYDQTHLLTLIAGAKLPRNWRISGRFRYVTGPLTTAPTGATGDMDNDVFIPTTGALYTTRLDSFMALDLRFDKRWIYNTWILSLYIDIQNVLNRKNSEGLQYSYDYRSSVSINDLPILPTVGLKGEF